MVGNGSELGSGLSGGGGGGKQVGWLARMSEKIENEK